MKLGETRIHVESCESTQELLDPSMAEGTVAVADVQTAGPRPARPRRGRRRRARPCSPPCCSSRRRTGRCRSSRWSPASPSPTRSSELTGLAVQIKWPNDVMLRRTKVAGILAEARDGAVVLGIGVNVNQTRAQLPERAGSLRTATGLRVGPRRGPRRHPRRASASRYEQWREGGLDAVYDGLGARDFLRGRTVTVDGTTGVGRADRPRRPARGSPSAAATRDGRERGGDL